MFTTFHQQFVPIVSGHTINKIWIQEGIKKQQINDILKNAKAQKLIIQYCMTRHNCFFNSVSTDNNDIFHYVHYLSSTICTIVSRSYTKAKNTDVQTYRKSSGLEAVIGFLYLDHQNERLDALLVYF
jgi:hypothetical protein